MKKYFCVAGHFFSILAPETFDWGLLGNYSVFSVSEQSGCLFEIRIADKLPAVEKNLFFTSQENPDETRLDIYSYDGGYYVDVAPSSRFPISGSMMIDSAYSAIDIYIKEESKARFVIDNAAMMIYAFATAGFDTLLMHSSVVVSDGRAYMFLAPSGTGKSTHSKMWLRNVPNTRLLNDDNPVVRITDGVAVCYGTPWSGKTPCYKNESAPVGALVTIKRDSGNHTERLDAISAFVSLLGSTSGLKSDSSMGDGLYSTMEKIISTVPCFDMYCRPDADAAIVCSSAVKGAAVCSSDCFHCELPNEILLPEVERLLSEGHTVELMAKGCSMLPYIVGDRDSVRLARKPEYEVGDIVLARVFAKKYVLHRIRHIGSDGKVTLMGDGNIRGTESCDLSDICGKVVSIEKPGKSIVPGKAWFWGRMIPVRRYLLFIFRRLSPLL